MTLQTQRIHGGPDALGAVQFDFSTNSNACGPCPAALAAIQQADASQYPDASYSVLRGQLAAFHDVDVQRVVLAASASEFIFRITAMVARRGGRSVGLPPYSYGDYAHAAAAHGLEVVDAHVADLCWACEPSSPVGQEHAEWHSASSAVRVLDRAYEPLRLSGAFAHAGDLDKLWQLYSPNKALGLTGVRAAYAIAPLDAETDIETMNQLCPSWPIGAHGVAMLTAWTQADTQAWLAGTLATLRQWKIQQTALCESLGWTVLPSLANFFVCSIGDGLRIESAMTQLRQHGIKLRDCTSFGLPSHVRISVQPPAAQSALHNAWLYIKGRT
ncbi:MAG: aminotransferase class I/II-fold pyridoxal phosphate-dependent enzyme [Chitinophagaceae bacterium]|nr:aminotransferase class I/II-fold pyridoxal phosphate-dependent enzyme [Polaromonas sp.]